MRPYGQRGDGYAAVVEGGQELLEALSGPAEKVRFGDAAAVEDQAVGVGGVPAHLAVRRLHDEPRSACGHDDRRHALVGEGGDRHQAGDVSAGVGDERLGTVDHPLRLGARGVQHGSCLGGAGVGAAVGFGEAEACQGPACDEVGQVGVLLVR